MSCQNHNIAILSLWTPKSVHTGCVSYFRPNLINRCRFSIFLHHFGHFHSESGTSHSEKVTFWGGGHLCFHVFHQQIFFKNRKCFCFLKEWKQSFRTVPMPASNSQWASRTVKNKMTVLISKLAPTKFSILWQYGENGRVPTLKFEVPFCVWPFSKLIGSWTLA